MSDITLSVQSIGNGLVTNEKVSFILSDKLSDNLRPGMLLTFSELPDLSLLNNDNLLKLNLVLPNGESIQVMAKTNLSMNRIDFAKPNLALRVTQDSNLQLVTVKSENINNINNVFSYTSSVPEVVSHPAKLMPVLDKIMQEENVSADIKKWVGEVMADTEVVAKLKGFEGNINSDDILASVKQTLRNLKRALPEQSDIFKQQFIKDVENLAGKSFEAKYSYTEGKVKVSVLETPLGKIFSDSMPKLTQDEVVQMEVLKVSLGNKPELLRIIDDFGKQLMTVLPNDNRHVNSLFSLLQNSNNESTFLVKILSPLLGMVDGEKYVANLLQKIPGLKTNVMSDIYNYYKAAQSGGVKEWLGDNLYGELRTSANGKEVLQNIEQLLQSSLKETPIWKIVELPFFDGNQLFNWRISVKKNGDERENEKNKRPNEEVRFVIDTEFSKLGAFQFDGFALKKQKRFDLIIRTSLSQSEDFCANIMSLFKKSLLDLNYSGTIKINQKETFLKPYVNENNVVDGVYV